MTMILVSTITVDCACAKGALSTNIDDHFLISAFRFRFNFHLPDQSSGVSTDPSTRRREMANSPEYNSIVDCIPELRRSVKRNIISLCGELLRARLINENKEESLRNTVREEADRAADLVSLLTNEVREDPENYHKFLAILKKDEWRYKTVIVLMEESYEAHVKSVEGPKPSSGQDNGV